MFPCQRKCRARCSPIASIIDLVCFSRCLIGARANPGLVEEPRKFGHAVPASAANAEKELGRAAGVNADGSELFHESCERESGSTAADEGDVERLLAETVFDLGFK